MSFLVLLLALWVEKFSAGRQRIQQDGFWLRQLAAVQARGATPALALALLVLAKMGIISSRFLAKQRRMMILVAFIIGGIITPTPDIFTQTMMAIPIILLYEASIWVVKILLRK